MSTKRSLTVMTSSLRDDWRTPKSLFDDLNQEFSFDLDPASNDFNFKCEKHFTIKDNGLVQSWANHSVYLNPPYGREIYDWCKKAYLEKDKAKVIVALLPARTDTRWFHEFIYKKAEIRFIKGRVHFDESKNAAPFPSMIVIWKNILFNN